MGRGQILLIFVGHDKDSKCKRESIVDFKQDVASSDYTSVWVQCGNSTVKW